MFQRLLEFSRSLPPMDDWERLNEGMPQNYDRGIAICFDDQGEWRLQDRQGNEGVVYRSGPPNGVDCTPCNIDARLFGATLPLGKGDPSLQLTGPVQFSVFNRSLHRVSPQLVQQTAAYAGKVSADQKSFAERWLLPYTLIAAYGVVNENAAATTEMRKEDLDVLLIALWQGTAGLNSHSKIGHQPLLLMLLQYRPGYRLGALPGRLRLAQNTKADMALRSTDDYRLNVGELLGALADYEPLEHISVHQDPHLRCTDGEAEGGLAELAKSRGLAVSPLVP